MLRTLGINIVMAICVLLSAQIGKAQQPNIVFIFADDLSYHDVGAYGNSEVQTPHIDALAKEGIKFTRAYNMGSWSPAVCMPSRTMLNTGQYLWNAEQAYSEDYSQIRQSDDFWSQKLKEAGYETYFTGKWHVPNLDPRDLFDHVAHVRPGMPEQTEAGYDRPHEGEEDSWSPYDTTFGGFWEGGTHWSEVLADDANNFINDASGSDKPFFMYLAFNAPHDPRQSPKKFVESYDPGKLQIPENYLPEYPFKNPIGAGRVNEQNRPHPPDTPKGVIESSQYLRDERLAPFPRTEYAVQKHRQEYYAIISHMDEQIGHILDQLKNKGELEHTIFVFTSDHGLAVGQHGFMGKQNMYEHSLKVPFIMAGPGIPAGEVFNASIYLQDAVPTTVELAGGEVPDSYQFRSLLSLIRGEETELHPAIYGAYLDKQRTVIEWPHKLILYPDIQKVRLYNLEEDPFETEDLAKQEDSKPVIKGLIKRLSELQKETGDDFVLTKIYSEWF